MKEEIRQAINELFFFFYVLGGAAWGGLVHKIFNNLPFFGVFFIVFLRFY